MKKKSQEPDLLAKWASVPKFAGKYRSTSRPVSTPLLPVKSKAEVPVIRPARYVVGGGYKKQAPEYTGDKMLGVTVMHKSCLQPVFSQEAAIDAAKMRR